MKDYSVKYQHTNDLGYLTGSVITDQVSALEPSDAIEKIRQIGLDAGAVGVRILKVSPAVEEARPVERSSGLLGKIVLGGLGSIMLLQVLAGQ